jgi:TRAP transporter TAXI family solute receptor
MSAMRNLWQRFLHLSLHDAVIIGVAALAFLFAVFWATYKFMRPAPPSHVTIVTGPADGAYQIYAARYKDFFARSGITLDIKASAGSAENLQRLQDRSDDVDIGFLQSGATLGKEVEGLVSLGVIYPEPLWLFHQHDLNLTNLEELKGKRVAIGPEGSGTRSLALELLRAHGVADAPTVLSPLGGMNAAMALLNKEIDAVFIVGPAQSSAVWTMLYSPNLEMFSFTQAEAYVRRFPYLTSLTLPRGTIDLPQNIPSKDMSLVAPSTNLVARDNFHPALIDLTLQALSANHGGAGLFARAGQFPTPNGVEIPLSREAERYYKNGKPFLQRYLPFWAATLVDRLVFMLLPIIALLFPLFRIAPFLYSWRIRRRIFRYYGELKLIELEAQQKPESKSREEWLEEIDRIERAAHRIPTPLAFADQVYTLRQHVHMVRKALLYQFSGTAKSQ